jgi:hypothetical protein
VKKGGSHNQDIKVNKLITSLSYAIKENNEKIKVTEEELTNTKENLGNGERMNDLKRAIQELQVKLKDQHNINYILIQSIKLSSETIAALHFENAHMKQSTLQNLNGGNIYFHN